MWAAEFLKTFKFIVSMNRHNLQHLSLYSQMQTMIIFTDIIVVIIVIVVIVVFIAGNVMLFVIKIC